MGESERAYRPPAVVLLPAFLVLAFAMTFRDLDRFGTHLVGDSADGLLVLWILGWVQHAVPMGWDAIWNANIYYPAPNTLAYAESMLPVAFVNWPLRSLFGEPAGLNIVFVAAETASLWFMYRLALRLTGSWPASIVAALAFSFSAPRLSQLGHTQLTLAGFLIPLTFLLLLMYFERPRLLVAAGIGVALGVTATSAAYYGVMMAVAVPVFVLGYLVWFRPREIQTFAMGLLLSALVAAVIVVPVGLEYVDLRQDPYFETGFLPRYAAHVEDFIAPPQKAYLLPDLPVFETRATGHNLERRLFPGIVALGFGAVGAVAVVRAARRRRADQATRRARLTLLLVATGVVSLVLAFGDEVTIAGQTITLPYGYLRDFVPGFSGIRVLSRFVLVTQCALAVLAAFGIRALLRRLHRGVALAVAGALALFVIAETAVDVTLTRVPDSPVTNAVGETLADRPDGVVAELPMMSPADGLSWPYLESPRQYVSLLDDNPRVNGYSGYAPAGFDGVVQVLNTFPSRAALRVADAHGVRYVVLRTSVIGQSGLRSDLEKNGEGRYNRATAERRIARIPPDRLRSVARLPGAYLVELRPARAVSGGDAGR